MNEGSILYADDDPSDVYFLQFAFEQVQIPNPLQIARDGQEAIDYLSGNGSFAERGRPLQPSLIILDLKMPRKTGFEVLEWIRQQPALRYVPVMVFSASGHSLDVENAYRLGANAFVVKPISVDDRLELAKLIKGFWLRFNEPPPTGFEPQAATAIPQNPRLA